MALGDAPERDERVQLLQAALRGFSRCENKLDDIALDLAVHINRFGRTARLQNLLGSHDGLGPGHRPRAHAAHDFELFVAVRVPHRQLEHEAVHLRFGERVRPLLVDRVLRGEHQERRRQREGRLADRHRVFLHGLEQRRLDLGGRAVDLVGEDHVGEDRALLGLELGLLRVVDQRADQVRGQQIRRELDALERGPDRVGERADGEGFGKAGHPLHEDVPVGQQTDEQPFDHCLLSHDHTADFIEQAVYKAARLLNLRLYDFDVAVHATLRFQVQGGGRTLTLLTPFFRDNINGSAAARNGCRTRARQGRATGAPSRRGPVVLLQMTLSGGISMRSSNLPVAALVVAAVSACGGEAGRATGPMVRDSAGVRIVEYAGLADSEPSLALAPEPLYRHGGGAGEYAFGLIGVGRLFPDGSAALSDYGTSEIVLLTPDAAEHRVMARAGEGPGEVGYVRDMFTRGQDSLLVLDFRNSSVSLFVNGSLVVTESLVDLRRNTSQWPVGLDDAGNLLTATTSFRSGFEEEAIQWGRGITARNPVSLTGTARSAVLAVAVCRGRFG